MCDCASPLIALIEPAAAWLCPPLRDTLSGNMLQMLGDIFITSGAHAGAARAHTRAFVMKFHLGRICFQVIRTPSNTRADLLNPEIQPCLLPGDNLNATFLPHKEKKKSVCVREGERKRERVCA